MAVHPTNANIVYVGTGDYDVGFPRLAAGIIKSIDGGNTWAISNPDPYENAVSAIVIDPENPQIVTATSGRGSRTLGAIHRTADGGASWGYALTPGDGTWGDIEIGAKDASGVRWYYAVGQHNHGAIWRSSDRGVNWELAALPWSTKSWFGSPDCEAVAVEVAASRFRPKTVYVAASPRCSGTEQATELYVSDDAGITFRALAGTNAPSIYTQGGYDLMLACSGSTEDVVYFGGQGELYGYRSSTGAWQYINSGHADQHGFSVNPANHTGVMIANDGGVYSQTFNVSTGTWSSSPINLNATLSITQFYSLATHPGDLTRMLGGTQDNAVVASLGTLTKWEQKIGGDGGFTAYHRSSPSTIYASNNGPSLYRSTDSGASFSDASPPWFGDTVMPLGAYGQDPNSANRMFATGFSTKAIAVAKGDSNIVYTAATDGSVWMIKNATGTPSSSDIRDLSLTLPDRGIRPLMDVSVNPSNKYDILISGDRIGTNLGAGGLWRCRNTSASSPVWESANGSDRSTSLPIVGTGQIARDPDDPTNTWYVATEVGMFYTSNAGATWSNATAPLGLPNVPMFSLDLNASTRYLTVGTFGRGAWRIALTGGNRPDVVVTASSPSAPAAGTSVTFTATIKNQGAAATPANVIHTVAFYIDGSLVTSSKSSTSSLAVGSTRTLTASTTWKATSGSHTLLVKWDEPNRISESNETNNTRTVTVKVP